MRKMNGLTNCPMDRSDFRLLFNLCDMAERSGPSIAGFRFTEHWSGGNCLCCLPVFARKEGGQMRGGRREGAGPPPGAKNKRTREVDVAMMTVATQFTDAVPDAFQGDGVAFLQTVYKNPTVPLAVRLDTAAKAARFGTCQRL